MEGGYMKQRKGRQRTKAERARLDNAYVHIHDKIQLTDARGQVVEVSKNGSDVLRKLSDGQRAG